MSLTKKDRKIQPILRKEFPQTNQHQVGASQPFASAIAQALKREYAGRRGAVKLVARLTGANERAVKNWFDGSNGPNGENLIVLAQHSSHVLESFLLLAARGELVTTKNLVEVKAKLKAISLLIDEL